MKISARFRLFWDGSRGNQHPARVRSRVKGIRIAMLPTRSTEDNTCGKFMRVHLHGFML